MDTNGDKLRDLLRKRRFILGLSTADVERMSRRGGQEGISSGYVSLIETGQIKNVSPQKLAVLARVLQITEAEIFALAAGTQPDKAAITNERLARINFGYEGMPKSKQKQLDPLIDLLEREYQRIKNDE